MLGRTDITEDEYFDVLQRKTAFLFSACCEIGAILGGANREQQTALRDFGLNLGTAFQLADDLLDFTADADVLGKAAGADLLEGKLTLPLILLLRRDEAKRADLEQIMHDGDYRKNSREHLLASLKERETLVETKRRAAGYAIKAQQNLEILPESKYREALAEIAAFIVNRES
jgi:octaprenyl-diphosphate synthase